MSDCPTPNTNCDNPIGAPQPADPCAPCFASDPKDMFDLVKSLSQQVCALDTRLSNLYQLFGRTRNRLTTVENTLNNLPGEEETSAVGCAGLETTSEADAVIVCHDGAEKVFVPSDTPEHIVFCGGTVKKVPKGLQWYPLTTKQLVETQTNMSTNNVVKTLSEFPEDACGPVWAVFNSVGQAFQGGSGSGTSVQVVLNGNELLVCGFYGDFAFSQAMVATPTASITLEITSAGTGVRTFTTHLLGYFY